MPSICPCQYVCRYVSCIYIDDHGGVRLRVLLERLQAVRPTELSSPRTRAYIWQGQYMARSRATAEVLILAL